MHSNQNIFMGKNQRANSVEKIRRRRQSTMAKRAILYYTTSQPAG